MIHSLAIAIAKNWSVIGVISNKDIESYEYGIELLISTLVNILIMIGVSVILDNSQLLFPYLLVFIPFRVFSGGFHSRSHASCIIINSVLYLIALRLVTVLHSLSEAAIALFCIIESCLSLTTVYFLSPNQSKNNPLSPSKRIKCHRISLVIAFSLLVFCILCHYLCLWKTECFVALYVGEAIGTLLLLAGSAKLCCN